MIIRHLCGKSDQVLGILQQKWGELTHNQFNVINGRRKALIGRIKELHATADELTRKAYMKTK